ncbi:type II toxin-antitoxin system RelE family toxin [Sulfurimonas sp.]
MHVVKKQVRIIYEIIDDILVVYVVAIGKREDMEVYRQAEQRNR